MQTQSCMADCSKACLLLLANTLAAPAGARKQLPDKSGDLTCLNNAGPYMVGASHAVHKF